MADHNDRCRTLGIEPQFFGLMVSAQNSTLHKIEYPNIQNEDLFKNRNLSITKAYSFVEPLVYVDEYNKPIKYIYALSSKQDSNRFMMNDLESKMLIESKVKIRNFDKAVLEGLLSPYWSGVDKDIVASFEYLGVSISDDAEYLKLESKPWKWYWHILIIFLAGLFFYRMFEALYAKMKKPKE